MARGAVIGKLLDDDGDQTLSTQLKEPGPSQKPAEASPGIARVETSGVQLPQSAMLRRAARKAGRIARYLGMAARYRAAEAPKPVMIVCQNRSGSTFLNRLFGAHPQCWTYTEGDHQEAMNQRDCPRWLSGQPYLRRWQIKDCSWIERYQTRVWLAAMAQGYPFGVFKIPHALAKVVAIEKIVPEMQFVLLVRHPVAQVASALSRGNRAQHLRIKADVLIHFLIHERDGVDNLTIVRYEDLLANPVECFGRLCATLTMDDDRGLIRHCVNRVGVRPGRCRDDSPVPRAMSGRIEMLCRLLGYELRPHDFGEALEQNL